MAISIDWTNKRITIPRADMTLTQGSPEFRSLDVNAFRGEVATLFASEEGGPYSIPFIHIGEYTISGVLYARAVQFLYEVEFEDGQYTVFPAGGNHNILDVSVANQVRIGVQNSAGLIGITDLASLITDATLARKLMSNRMEVDITGQQLVAYDDDGTPVLYSWPLDTDAGEDVTTALGVQTKRLAPTVAP